MVQHADLTGIDLHEPKGIATAPQWSLYWADGAGSGNWWSFLDVVLNANLDTGYGYFPDVSTASSIYIPLGSYVTVLKISICLQAPITTADSTITAYNSTGSSMGSVNVTYTGSAAGQVFTITPVTNNSVGVNSFIRLTSDGASSGVSPAIVRVTAQYEY